MIASAIIVGIAGTIILATIQSVRPAEPSYVGAGETVDPNTLPGIQTGPTPWSPETAHLQQRIASLGVPPTSTMEGSALHIHQHIDIYVHGARLTVPQYIGIITQPSVLFAPIHTHDTSGIIHVESPVARDFSLGEFFDVWGLRFTSSCVGGYCANADDRLRVYGNGRLLTRDPRQLALTQHEEIVVIFGTSRELPSSIASSYEFPSGL
ncbi:MAG: hypothetical protein LC663_05885 [Actinobacteria bacterium]|nr:hypothetical protein [Actinomycetota bacterium]